MTQREDMRMLQALPHPQKLAVHRGSHTAGHGHKYTPETEAQNEKLWKTPEWPQIHSFGVWIQSSLFQSPNSKGFSIFSHCFCHPARHIVPRGSCLNEFLQTSSPNRHSFPVNAVTAVRLEHASCKDIIAPAHPVGS